MHIVELSDPADPRLDDFRDLMDADVRPERRGIVIAEGVNVVERLALSPYRVRAVVGVPARIDALQDEMKKLQQQLKKGAAADLSTAADKLFADVGVRLLTGSLFMPLRKHDYWLRCPVCEHRTWCNVSWRG